MTALSPKDDRIGVWSNALQQMAETSPGTLIKGGLAAGANITLSYNVGTGVTTITANVTGRAFTASPTPPTTANIADEWFDTQNDRLLKRMDDGGGAGPVWVDISGR